MVNNIKRVSYLRLLGHFKPSYLKEIVIYIFLLSEKNNQKNQTNKKTKP